MTEFLITVESDSHEEHFRVEAPSRPEACTEAESAFAQMHGRREVKGVTNSVNLDDAHYRSDA